MRPNCETCDYKWLKPVTYEAFLTNMLSERKRLLMLRVVARGVLTDNRPISPMMETGVGVSG